MKTSPRKQKDAQPTQTPSIPRSRNAFFLRASSVCAQIARPVPLAAPDDNNDISYFPAQYHVPLWYCRKDISKIIPTSLTHLCKCVLITPAGKSSIAQ